MIIINKPTTLTIELLDSMCRTFLKSKRVSAMGYEVYAVKCLNKQLSRKEVKYFYKNIIFRLLISDSRKKLLLISFDKDDYMFDTETIELSTILNNIVLLNA